MAEWCTQAEGRTVAVPGPNERVQSITFERAKDEWDPLVEARGYRGHRARACQPGCRDRLASLKGVCHYLGCGTASLAQSCHIVVPGQPMPELVPQMWL
jgi:hypothetical protein